ncbi:MAG: peptidase S41 [Flavobacterium sp.]|nr:MAG: peptidase S41 [Flavobacterium sp.]
MKQFIRVAAAFAILITFHSCEIQDENLVPKNLEINDFVWKGMNLYYLWQPDVSDLADDRFTNQDGLNSFLGNYSDPEELFNHLRVDPTVDRFSVIFSDYTVLEGILSGTTGNTGADYGLRYKSGSSTDIFGWVRYILPNSDASTKNIHRGDLFYAVNGTPLTINNYEQLLGANTVTLNLADYDNGNITPNGQSVTLTKTNYSENPVYLATTIESGSHKIGYLMYNGFYPHYETELNNAIGQFKAQGSTDLVLDLRYNSGGSIATANRLASMITGQFTGSLFAKEQWNPKAQAYFEDHNPADLENRFTNVLGNGAPINTLNLNRLYVLTTKSTASASELVINGLAPYIDVVQIGDATIGKNVGSITLYDSPDFGKDGRSNDHKYAMQPIVLRLVNKNGFGDYTSGLPADFSLIEDMSNLSILGTESEPLLAAAIAQITGSGRKLPSPAKNFNYFKDVKSIVPAGAQMYREHLPQGIGQLLK